MTNKRLIFFSSGAETNPERRRWRLRFVDLLVRICLRFILWRLIFPVPVTLNVLRALRCDFIFGMFSLCVMLVYFLVPISPALPWQTYPARRRRSYYVPPYAEVGRSSQHQQGVQSADSIDSHRGLCTLSPVP